MATAALPTALETARQHHARNDLLHAAEAYRQTLQSDPRSQAALLGLSLIARQSNQLQPAFRMAQAALAAGPGSALAWSNYGDMLMALHQIPQAQSAFRRALMRDSELAPAHYGLANTFALEDDFAAALSSFQSAAKLAPNFPEFHFAQAFAHGKLGQHREAIVAYRRAVTLRPGFASAWLNLGVELIADGSDHLAVLCYHQALAAAEKNTNTRISTLLNLGHLQRSRRDYPEACYRYQQALTLAESNCKARLSEIHVANTYFHLEQKQFAEAWQSLNAAEAADPTGQNPEVPNARGILLLADQAQSRVPQVSHLRPGIDAAPMSDSNVQAAIAAFQQAESLGHKTAASNRGNALLQLGRCAEALAAHQRALQLDPHHPGVRYNLALTQLRLGDFTRGWPNYEIRWQFREVHPHPRRFHQPRWQGEPLTPPATLLIYAEQGLGDTIQFARYLTLVAERLTTQHSPGAPHLALEMWDSADTPADQATRIHLVFEVQPPLVRLLTPLLRQLTVEHPNITTEILSHGAPLPDFTHHFPLMSLPAIFQTRLATIPARVPYLVPPLTESRLGVPSFFLAAQEGRDKPTPRIGLAWAGNPKYRADHDRSTQLETFLPLLQLPNIHWISLQKGEASTQIARIPPEFAPSDACSRDCDLADTAAVIANLDLVITTDTVVAHLAGALGRPLWILLPWQSDWRWMQDRLTTPWYPAARLFRQSSANNWSELIQRVVAETHRWQQTRQLTVL